MTRRAWCAIVVTAGCGRISFDAAPLAGARLDASVDLTQGLVGWWKLDEASGTSTADSSGSGITGTFLGGVSWTAGMFDAAITLDGTSNTAVDLGDPPALHLTGSMTLAAWVNASSFKLGDAFDDNIVARDDLNHSDQGFSLKGSEDCNGTETFAVQVAAAALTPVERCSTISPLTGTWYHVTGVFDAPAQRLDIYVNGALDNGGLLNPVPAAQHAPGSPVHLQIGDANPGTSTTAGGNNSFAGIIDDVRIYDRALDATEVAVLATP